MIDAESSFFSLVVLVFVLLDKAAELPYFLCLSFVEVETVPFSVPDLQEVVIEGLFYYPYLGGRSFQVHVNHLSRLVQEARVQLSPESHFLDHFLNCFLLLLCLLAFGWVHLCIFLPLLFLEKIKTGGHLFPEAKFEAVLVVGGWGKGGFGDFLAEPFLVEVVLPELRGEGEAKDVECLVLMEVAD